MFIGVSGLVRPCFTVNCAGAMEAHDAVQAPVTPMELFRVYWVCTASCGEIMTWAPDGETLEATVRENPSSFGIPHEDVIVGRSRRCDTP